MFGAFLLGSFCVWVWDQLLFPSTYACATKPLQTQLLQVPGRKLSLSQSPNNPTGKNVHTVHGLISGLHGGLGFHRVYRVYVGFIGYRVRKPLGRRCRRLCRP